MFLVSLYSLILPFVGVGNSFLREETSRLPTSMEAPLKCTAGPCESLTVAFLALVWVRSGSSSLEGEKNWLSRTGEAMAATGEAAEEMDFDLA